jgi:hypothetical protein
VNESLTALRLQRYRKSCCHELLECSIGYRAKGNFTGLSSHGDLHGIPERFAVKALYLLGAF